MIKILVDWWPQLGYLAILTFELGIVAERHGKPREGKYNLAVTMVAVVVNLLFLYYGGFFVGVRP